MLRTKGANPAKGPQESAGGADLLARLSEELNQLVGQFKLQAA